MNNFFKDIEEWINSNNVSILINNVGHRVAVLDYTKMDRNEIKNTIMCGTIPQSILTQIAINKFISRVGGYRTWIINITAQCFTYNMGLGVMYKPGITVPYLACYEAANAYGGIIITKVYWRRLGLKSKVTKDIKNRDIKHYARGGNYG